jgi:ribosomal-protein-alanine acetyltransferase
MARVRSALNSRAPVRDGRPEDLERVAEIQAASPGASHWNVRDYLDQDFRVVECSGTLAGFAVARRVAEDESELLNLAVAPSFRRSGIATVLMHDLAVRHPGTIFLEVRESNKAALALYQAFGFEMVAQRPEYYRDPVEGAVVMKYRSCYCHR